MTIQDEAVSFILIFLLQLRSKSSKCVLCGECANACPTGALKIIEWKDITV